MALELQSASLSNSIFLGGDEEHLELLSNKLPADHTTTMIYVCENKTCQQPTPSVDVALKLLTS
jgi:uncharacterized protein YyaL (SSP411 family)